MLTHEQLVSELNRSRLESYAKLRGGFPVPLAGATYWFIVAIMGAKFEMAQWLFYSFFATGLIFPLAVLFAKLFKNNFMKEKDVVGNVFIPACIGMLLFWPMMVGVMQVAPEAAILLLGIGMSAHWPVIGWSYGRTALFSAHSIIRAVVILGLWLYFPEGRMTIIPLAIAIIYLLTVAAIYIDSGRVKAKLGGVISA